MLFYVKRSATTSLLALLALLIIANVWARVRGIDLGAAASFNLSAVVLALVGIAFIFSLDGVIYMINWFVGVQPFLKRFDAEMGPMFAQVQPFTIVAGALCAALGEETFFRGVLQQEWGIVPTALLFALAHASRNIRLLALWAVLQSIVFSWLYALSGNLLVPMIVHGAHDLFGMVFARYLYKRLIPPAETLFDWLSRLNEPGAALRNRASLVVLNDRRESQR